MGDVIATITAVGVVSLGFSPDLAVWLGPTALIAPAVIWWTSCVTRSAIRAQLIARSHDHARTSPDPHRRGRSPDLPC